MYAKKETFGILILLLFLATACTVTLGDFTVHSLPVGPLQNDSKVIEVGPAETAQVDILMRAGELTLTGGSDHLVEADFTYNIESWTPEVDYLIADRRGTVTIEQPDALDGIPTEKVRNHWKVRLNNDIPLDLRLEVGAGASTLDLDELSLESLQVRAGAGESHLNLGNASVPNLTVEAGLGAMSIDLSGRWENDLEAKIRNGVGELTVKVPREVGVRVDVATGLVDVQSNGFKRVDGAYVNSAYGQTDVTLNIDIQGGLGNINLQLVES